MATSVKKRTATGNRSDELYDQLADIITRHTTLSGEDKTAIPGLYLSRTEAPSHPKYVSQWPCVALVIQGRKSVTLGQKVFNYGVGDYVFVSVDLPVISQITLASKAHPQLAMGMEINPERLHQLFNRITVPGRSLKLTGIKGITVSKAPVDMLDAILRLLQLLDRQEDIAALAPLIEQEIIYRVLTGPYGMQLLRFAREAAPTSRIAKAIAWLREHYSETLHIKVLARQVGMSPSSLHEHFKAITLLTPMQYQKKIRLHEARKLMLLDQLDANEAAFEVGYQSPAQFSREYSRLYGDSPLRDVARLRKEGRGA